MMGGSVSHEFMLLTDCGEDTIVLCDECGYSSNMEAADCIVDAPETTEAPLEKVHTPGTKTIEAVCEFLHAPANASCKAVVYQKNLTDEYVIAFIRGDFWRSTRPSCATSSARKSIRLKLPLRAALLPALSVRLVCRRAFRS